MGFFDVFKGKDPARLEEQGDRLYESGAYGQARLEYESAAAKRRRETPTSFSAAPQLFFPNSPPFVRHHR